MKQISLTITCFLLLFATLLQASESPVADLIQRIAPQQAEHITLQTIPNKQGKVNNRHFQISERAGKLVLAGDSRLSQVAAFGWYLKHVNHSSLSWGGDHISPSLTLPSGAIDKSTPYEFRFAYNYCTLSYTMAFWDWSRWEREIDFLAVNGYTHALVTAGLEKVWQLTLRDLNYPEAEIKKFIPNPAFAAWWNMGNLEGHGGPLTQHLIDGEARLGKKITTRMKSLGITPVLPGFVGILPRNIGKYVKGLKLIPQGRWAGGFERPIVLDPTTPEYQKIAAIWYKNLHRVYGGTTTAYAGDLFHEGGRHTGINVTEAAKAVNVAMQKASPGSTWVLQSWGGNPLPDLVKGTDPQRTIILQLDKNMSYTKNARSMRTYQGRPWLWAELSNFGGNHGLYGGNQLVSHLPSLLLHSPKARGKMSGLALLSEGIETNPFYYAIFHDAFWRDQDIDLSTWIPAYSERRYGKKNPDAIRALNLLNQSVYNPKRTQEGCTESILCARPRRDATKASTWSSGAVYYKPLDVLHAAEALRHAAPELKQETTYRYDLTDVTRQVLADLARPVLARAMYAYDHKNTADFKKWSAIYLSLIRDTDTLLATEPHWLLGTWIARARAKGATAEEKDLMETAARMQITTWSGKHDNLDDYSHRQWAGLMKDYYLPRWQTFFKLHLDVLENRIDRKELNNWYNEHQMKRDIAFAKQRKTYPTQAKGDTVKVATLLLTRYAPLVNELAKANKIDGFPWILGDKKELTWDVSDVFMKPGTYKCTITWKHGQSALKIHSLALYEGKKLIVKDVHEGETGWKHKNNTYIIPLKKVRTSLDSYTLKAKVSGVSGTDSQGVLTIQ